MTTSPTPRKGATPSGRAPSGTVTAYGASTGPSVGGGASGIGRTSGIRTPYGLPQRVGVTFAMAMRRPAFCSYGAKLG